MLEKGRKGENGKGEGGVKCERPGGWGSRLMPKLHECLFTVVGYRFSDGGLKLFS